MANLESINSCFQCTGYSRELVKSILDEAIRDFRKIEPNIDEFSSETHPTEWNLVAHLAPEIARRFHGYSYDIDVIKSNYHNKRPDIIIHHRGTNEKNLLVIEVKKRGDPEDLAYDENKIKEHWFVGRLNYCLGATINLVAAGSDEVNVFFNHVQV